MSYPPFPRMSERKSRRTHKNSRDGCPNCKAKRIKCSEELPSCHNCIKKNYRCGYLDFPKEKLDHIRKKNDKKSKEQDENTKEELSSNLQTDPTTFAFHKQNHGLSSGHGQSQTLLLHQMLQGQQLFNQFNYSNQPSSSSSFMPSSFSINQSRMGVPVSTALVRHSSSNQSLESSPPQNATPPIIPFTPLSTTPIQQPSNENSNNNSTNFLLAPPSVNNIHFSDNNSTSSNGTSNSNANNATNPPHDIFADLSPLNQDSFENNEFCLTRDDLRVALYRDSFHKLTSYDVSLSLIHI